MSAEEIVIDDLVDISEVLQNLEWSKTEFLKLAETCWAIAQITRNNEI